MFSHVELMGDSFFTLWPETGVGFLGKKYHTTNSAKHAPFQAERFAAVCSEVGAVTSRTDGLDSQNPSFQKVFVNLSNSRLQNTEQINTKKERLWGLTFLALML